MKKDKLNILNMVRTDYAKVAKGEPGGIPTSCCGTDEARETLLETGRRLGYSDKELALGLGEANLGLGCGNPQAIAELKEAETVLDLGSGAGFDAFLAGMSVGRKGTVIGVDMTPEMVNKARTNASRIDAQNVEFRLGEIEHLPVADSSVDVIISNCVINLSLDKQQVFKDAYRVLKPGGRLAISDILRGAELPRTVLDNPSAYSGWITGSVSVETLKNYLTEAGFTDLHIIDKENSSDIIRSWNLGDGVEKFVYSAYIKARKPN